MTAIARVSVLTGHVAGSLIQTLVAIVIGVALLLGFALTWLAVALGMVTKSVEAASNLPMPLPLLPFLA